MSEGRTKPISAATTNTYSGVTMPRNASVMMTVASVA
jgi:hypothetical protein